MHLPRPVVDLLLLLNQSDVHIGHQHASTGIILHTGLSKGSSCTLFRYYLRPIILNYYRIPLLFLILKVNFWFCIYSACLKLTISSLVNSGAKYWGWAFTDGTISPNPQHNIGFRGQMGRLRKKHCECDEKQEKGWNVLNSGNLQITASIRIEFQAAQTFYVLSDSVLVCVP